MSLLSPAASDMYNWRREHKETRAIIETPHFFLLGDEQQIERPVISCFFFDFRFSLSFFFLTEVMFYTQRLYVFL